MENSQRIPTAIFIVMVSFGLYGCDSSRTLTRGRAKDVIEASDTYKLKKHSIELTENEFTNLWRGGYLQVRVVFFQRQIEVAPKGKAFFDDAGQMPAMPAQVVTAIPIKPYVIEVSGITEGGTESEKLVEYTWNWDFKPLPEEVRYFFKDHPPERWKVTLKLYDDGWRAVKFEKGT